MSHAGAQKRSLTKLHFSRFEFKYVLQQALRDEIERELSYFLTLDPFVGRQVERKYFVRSLYFDDPVWTQYYEKTDGLLRRQKYRLRTYTDNPQQRCATFLEVKGRHDALVFKHRAHLGELSFADPATAKLDVEDLVLHHVAEGPVVEGFRFELARKLLRPVVRVDYHRRPYISRFDPEFRLTFDDGLVAMATRTVFPLAWERERALLRGRTVLEVKFRRHIPSWFHRIIQSYNLRRVSVSKYCKGVEALGLAPNLE